MKKLRCKHCKYTWTYKGKLVLASCPSCARKIRVADSIYKKRIKPAKTRGGKKK